MKKLDLTDYYKIKYIRQIISYFELSEFEQNSIDKNKKESGFFYFNGKLYNLQTFNEGRGEAWYYHDKIRITAIIDTTVEFIID